jgi:apolipoprotein N-acyltransferase
MGLQETTYKILKKHFSVKRLLPALSSVIIGLSFFSTHLSGLVLISLLPFAFYLKQAKALRRRQAMFDCWLAAFILSLLFSLWTLQTDPANWLNLVGSEATVIKVVTWLIISLWSSLGFGLVMGYGVGKVKGNTKRLFIAIPFIWALAELVRSYSLAVLFLGPGSSLSPNWNFGSLGLAAAWTQLAYISRFVGLFGLSAVVVIINIAIFLLLTKRFRKAAAIIAVVAILDFLAYQLYLPSSTQTMRVATVYLSGPGEFVNPWAGMPLPSKETNLLVLPEYSGFTESGQSEQFAKANFGERTIVVTSQAGTGEYHSNNLIYYSNRTGFVSSQAKTFLAPFGEYMPYSTEELLKLMGQQAVLTNFKQNSQLKQGSQPEHAVRINGITVGGLACSGVLNLNEYRRLSHEGAEVLTNSASLSLLDSASLYRVQELYQNRFHAIANAKPFVQSARTGASYVISSDGRVLAKSSKSTSLIQVTVHLQPKQTLYSWIP